MRTIALLVGKDLRLLRRSPALLAALIVYPVLVAVLVGLVVRYAGEQQRVAFVDEDGLPAEVELAGRTFDVRGVIDRVVQDVELITMTTEEADRALAAGDVLATITVPNGFLRRLRSLAGSPTLVVRMNNDLLGSRIMGKVQALVYNLNRTLQETFIEENLAYVDVLREGGTGTYAGQPFRVIGLLEAATLLAGISDRYPELGPELAPLADLVDDATRTLGTVDLSLRAIANPIDLETDQESGRNALLSSEVQGYGLALTLTFLAMLLAAGSLAAERDENTIGRLTRGLAGRTRLLLSKIALVGLVGGAIGAVLALAFAVAVEIYDDAAGMPWGRLPIVLAALVLISASLGALGALLGVLARDARAATLVAFLVALPIALLGLVPPSSIEATSALSQAFPFVHGVRLVDAALGDASPAREVLIEAGWLAGLGVAFAAMARLGVRRLAS